MRTNRTIKGSDIKYAVDEDNYLDICIVAYFDTPFIKCSLATNYIGLESDTVLGYSLNYALAKTQNPIDPTNVSHFKSGFYWDVLTWDDYQRSGATIKYHVLYENETGHYVEVENTTLPGNTEGFTTPPVCLNQLSKTEYHNMYKKLKIKANLTTDSPAVSPRIYSWAVTWQNTTKWQDSFNTYYRLDKRTKINKENGYITISPVQDEWPMFGFNTENIRASNCIGAKNNTLYWYSREYVGGGFRNPVIGNGQLYIASEKTLYQYNVTLPSGSSVGEAQSNISSVILNYNIVNSPAITDEYVIVATGQAEDGGHANYIYAYPKNNLSESAKWIFTNNNKMICYDASPVVTADTLFITTWGGDTGSYIIESNRYTNNRVIALDVENGNKTWEYELPAPSYSTPAVSVTNDIVIVGCSSSDNDSVFAFTLAGEKRWSTAVGAIGHAAPIIYEDTVFVTCKEEALGITTTKVIALSLDDGSILWNATISEILSLYGNLVDSTPAVYDDVLYVASPEGVLRAFDTMNGSVLWSATVYSRPLGSSSVLISSPAYADGLVYLGTPEGKIVAVDAGTGDTVWEFTTFLSPEFVRAPVLGSPVVSNGLLFISDENGYLYSIGMFRTPTEEITGRIISIPIKIPEAYWWSNFYYDAVYNVSLSTIKFKLLDEDGKNVLIENLINRSALTVGDNRSLGRTVRLQADFSTKNITQDNPKLLRWYITLTKDTDKPHLNLSTFTPDPKGWLNEVVPLFTIKVKDNSTGLRVNSAKYTLGYTTENVTHSGTFSASCSGTNGTTELQLLTVNLTSLNFFENITALHSLTISLEDLAGNLASKTVTFKQDTQPPSSSVSTKGMRQRYNMTSAFIRINATATDPGVANVNASGVKLIELYYRHSSTGNFSGSWVYFANSTKSQPYWNFSFTNRPTQDSGYFELCTVAIDQIGNMEEKPTHGDVSFLYDWKQPDLPDVSGDTLWFNERPEFSFEFSDDFRLHTIQYQPNFDSTWTTIASRINKSTYDAAWDLKEEYWEQMNEGEISYLYFKLNDTLGNVRLITSKTQAVIIRKDASKPTVDIEIPALETEWSWNNNFTISAFADDRNGSGIKEITLYYRYSNDKANWSEWNKYNKTLTEVPFEWDFIAAEGNGYYEFKIVAEDVAGNVAESAVFSSGITLFPIELVIIMIALVIALVLISVVILVKWRKKKD
jgi:outer membrane protein assembly factor BamB